MNKTITVNANRYDLRLRKEVNGYAYTAIRTSDGHVAAQGWTAGTMREGLQEAQAHLLEKVTR